jgi:hypothetical protein
LGLSDELCNRRDLRVRDWVSRAGEDHSDDHNENDFANGAGTSAA